MDTTAAPTPDDPKAEQAQPPPFTGWALDDCYGIEVPIRYSYLDSPGQSPPGWTFDPLRSNRVITQVTMHALHCQRVSIGGHEHAKVSMVLEEHSNFSSPEACTFEPVQQLAVLAQWLVDNVTLAESLSSHGIAAKLAAIRVASTNATYLHQEWTWSVDGIQETRFDAYSVGTSSRPFGQQLQRLAWWNGTALGMLDVQWDNSMPDPNLFAANGHISTEMTASDGQEQEFVGLVDYNVETQVAAKVVYVGAPDCSTPQPE